jgi:NEDD8-activating enzyme E1 regulatory subunit
MPDSLITLYIAFLAYDMFCGSHLVDGLGGALRAPGIADVDTDSEKLEGMVKTMIDDLLNEAGQFIEEPEYLETKVKAFQYVQEMYVL